MFKIAAFGAAGLLAAAAAAAIAAPVHSVKPSPKLVYKVDSVIATLAGSQLSIAVKGAVPSGGWKGAMLKLVRSAADPHTIVVNFLATPPAPDAPVIQGLLPVSANVVVPMRRGVITVQAVSSANEMTTQILKQPAADKPSLRRSSP